MNKNIIQLCGNHLIAKDNSNIMITYHLNKYKLILRAIKNNKVDIVKLLLLGNHIDPSINNNNAIICASRHGHLEVVRLLLNDSRVNPASQNNDAIKWASQNGYSEVVKLLLSDSRIGLINKNSDAYIYAKNELIKKLLLRDRRYLKNKYASIIEKIKIK